METTRKKDPIGTLIIFILAVLAVTGIAMAAISANHDQEGEQEMTNLKALRQKWPEGFILQATFLTPEGSTMNIETGLTAEAGQDIINTILDEVKKGGVPMMTGKPPTGKGKG